MGRPPGSKNKAKVQIVVDEETKPALDAAKRAKEEVSKMPGWKKGEITSKKAKQLTLPVAENIEQIKGIIQATAELAMTAGREYVVNKITAWKAGIEHDKLEVIMGDGDAIPYDEFILYFDGEKVDSKHVMHADVRDVVAGVLGLRA